MLFLEIIIIVIIFDTYSHITFNVSTSCSCTGGEVFARFKEIFSLINKDISGKHCTKMLYFSCKINEVG